jgi:hypothetical protein
LHSGQHASQWSLKAGKRIADDRIAKLLITLYITISVDEQLLNLRCKMMNDMRNQRLIYVRYQALVITAHTACFATGENDAGHGRVS